MSKKEKTKKLSELYDAKKYIENFDLEYIETIVGNQISREKSKSLKENYQKLHILETIINTALPPQYRSTIKSQIKNKNNLKLFLIGLPVFLIIFMPIANRMRINNNAKRNCLEYNYGVIPNKKDWGDIFAQNTYDGIYEFCLRINGYKGDWKY